MKDQATAQLGVEGLWPPGGHGLLSSQPHASVPVLVCFLPEESYVFQAT